MTQPTVGRVVWFWPSHEEQMALPPARQPLAAHVAAVSEDGSTVNLQVIDANGYAHARQDVPFYEGGHPGGQSYADWMPFQRLQHAKNEAAQIGSSDSPSMAVDERSVEAPPVEVSRFATTQATPDTNYETATTPAKPSAGGSSRFSSAS